MNVFSYLSDVVQVEIEAMSGAGLLPRGLDLSAVSVEPPREAEHGDAACNAALVLAKQARRKPREIAQNLAERLQGRADIRAVEVAGPGFVNLRLTDEFWWARLAELLQTGPGYGATDLGRGRPVNVEYVSTNPTGPLHVGHARGAVVGDALANLLSHMGFAVTREYYVNDAGAQVDTLARSVHARYREASGETIGAIPEGLYPGDYLVPVGEALAARDGRRWLEEPESVWLPEVRRFATDAMMDLVRADLEALGVATICFARSARWSTRAASMTRMRRWRGPISFTAAYWSRPRASATRTGSRANRVSSAPPPSATIRTGRSGSRTAPGPTSPPILPITATRSSAASPT